MISRLTGRCYEPSNSTMIWIANCKQVATYLYYDPDVYDDVIDVLATKKNNKLELVWVFKKTQRLKELYNMWNDRTFPD